MKLETRMAGNAKLVEMVKGTMGDKVILCRVGKNDCWAVDLGMTDPETGKPMYALLKPSVPNTADTKTTKAFDLGEAVQAYYDHENEVKAEKAAKPKKVDPEAEARKAAHNAREQELEKWLLANLDGEMTASEIYASAPGLDEVTLMQVGTYLKNIVGRNPIIQVNVEKGKKFYSKAV